MTTKEELVSELMNKLKNLPHAPVIATPGPSTNWRMTHEHTPTGIKTIHTTLVDDAELIFATKDWEARLLLPKHSVFEMNVNSSDSKMIINFVNMKPNDIVMDDN